MSKRTPYPTPSQPADAPLYYSSIEDLEAVLGRNPQLAERYEAAAQAEFPQGVDDAADAVSRRGFLQIMGASVGLATFAGCRRPVDHIVPFRSMPEHLTVGVPNTFASVVDRGAGDPIGVLVTSFEGRPTKIEGNPDHPNSRGGTDLRTQASILDLYDPDRSRTPSQRGAAKSWAEFEAYLARALEQHTADQGAGLRFLSEPTASPSFVRMRDAVKRRFPQASFHTWCAANTGNAAAATRLAFGQPLQVVPHFEHARIILSLDCDFLQTEPGAARNARGFADGRRLEHPSDTMNRLYAVEPVTSTTGSNADHRLRLPAREVEAYFAAVAARLASAHGADLGPLGAAVQAIAAPQGIPSRWIEAVAKDLWDHRGAGLVVAGVRQPARLHALVHAVNRALGNEGHTVEFITSPDPLAEDGVASLRALAEQLDRNAVKTLVILGGNPVHDAPADLAFAQRIAKAGVSVHLAHGPDETSRTTEWHLPLAHALESWGDHRAVNGAVGIQQPLIDPLFSGRSAIELLGLVAEGSHRRGYLIVRETYQISTGLQGADLERQWRRLLHDGIERASAVAQAPALRGAEIAQALGQRTGQPVSETNLELVFLVDNKMFDGRHANNSWLQELPDPVTKIVWDNALYVSPATGRRLNLRNGQTVEISKGDRKFQAPVWLLPGQADNVLGLGIGWGRSHAGRVGTLKGANGNALRTADAPWFVDGVQLRPAGEPHTLVQTQEHHKMEGRPIALEETLAGYRREPRFATRNSPTPRGLPLWREVDYSNKVKWSLIFDLNACTGCNACVVACQAENNIPVVGKDQVRRGREMHWVRVDRYFVGTRQEEQDEHALEADPAVAYQPLGCVQCEEAPCENVCPVNATAHSPDGLNDMAYNRCIGTRYCSNNCPYKVRRFNYLNWHNDSVWQEADPDTGAKDADLPQSLRMQQNPNVTVRFRGVMEKCTYCVQRIRVAEQAGHTAGKPDRGEGTWTRGVTTACAQACPSAAITFGDVNDHQSPAARWASNDRRYKLLGELGVQPRTTYLAKVRNPNPEMQG